MATPEKKTTQVVEKSVVDIVSEKVNAFLKSGQLVLPKDYVPDNATLSAYLSLNEVEDKSGNKVMVDGKLQNVCTKASIANAILDMVIQGLMPWKDQCYFIVYGKTLSCQRSYFGSMAVAQRVKPEIKDWGYNVVYQDDIFDYVIDHRNGKDSVIKHEQKIENISNAKIIAAYAMALDKDGNPLNCEIMSIEQIHQAWSMSKAKPFDEKGNLKQSSVHWKFARDMAIRTVVNKLAKFIINQSSDNALLLEHINRAQEIADAAAVQAEIEESANRGSVVMIPNELPEAIQLPEKGPEPDLHAPAAGEGQPTGEKHPEEKRNGRGPSF